KELERVQDDKMELYRKAKDDKMAATEFKCRQDADAARVLHELREYVRRSHNKAAEARMKLVEERQARRRAEMEEKYKKEEALMKATVEDIEMMEREERRLMEELQYKQKRQLEVYQHLEHILQATPRSSSILSGYHQHQEEGMIDGQVMVTHHYGDTINERASVSNTGIIHNDVEVLSDEETITTTPAPVVSYTTTTTTADHQHQQHSEETTTAPAAEAPVVSYTTTTADHHHQHQHSEKTTTAPAAAGPVVSYTTVDGVVVSLSDILDGLHDV
ncbi:hypothetical protein Pmar_PMAR012060, partial [Perkinsus marinus ATCC 50983]